MVIVGNLKYILPRISERRIRDALRNKRRMIGGVEPARGLQDACSVRRHHVIDGRRCDMPETSPIQEEHIDKANQWYVFSRAGARNE